MLDGGMPIAMEVTANCPDFATANTAVGLCMRTFSLTVQALNNIPPGWDLGRGLLRFLGLLGIWFFRLLECLGRWFLRSLICHCGDVVFAEVDSPLLFIFFWRAFLLGFCHTRPSSTLDRNCPIILEGAGAPWVYPAIVHESTTQDEVPLTGPILLPRSIFSIV